MMEKILDVQDVNTRDMTLSGLDLTSLCHTEWMVLVQELDVSQNHLTSLKPLSNLPCLVVLIANNNDIDSVEGLQHCKQLRKLHLQKNGGHCLILVKLNFKKLFQSPSRCLFKCMMCTIFFLTAFRTVQAFSLLSSLPLEDVNISGNPLCNTENYTEALKVILPVLAPSWGQYFLLSPWDEGKSATTIGVKRFGALLV